VLAITRALRQSQRALCQRYCLGVPARFVELRDPGVESCNITCVLSANRRRPAREQ
jgi:hypothetical protein